MKNNFIKSILLLSVTNLYSQVYINVREGNHIESASLQIDSNDKGMSIPTIALITSTDKSPVVATPKDGLLIYNTTNNSELEQGYYIWQTNKWNKIGGSKKVNTLTQLINWDILNIDATGEYQTSPSTINLPGNVSLSKQKCVQWRLEDAGNNHYYCMYKSAKNDINFANAYNAAKAAKSYIVTITSDEEWFFLRDKLIKTDITEKTWLGYALQKQPGNNLKYTWLTGESFNNKWSNAPDVQHHFQSGHPYESTAGSADKCTVINSSANSADRLWISNNCGENLNTVIIEFNK